MKSTQVPFAKKIQEKMGTMMKKSGKIGGIWHGRTYDHICLCVEDNFIDGQKPLKCDVKGELTHEEIKYHFGATHLNSSQIVCISFFKKFFERPEWEHFLLDMLKQCGLDIGLSSINNAVFEYELDKKERTNFDFYLVLDNKTRISFEIKYTESEFGGISPDAKDPDKYHNKWKQIYAMMVQQSPFLNCDETSFYSNYQINRNIVFAKQNDFVLFITPKANDTPGIISGRDYIDKVSKTYPNIRNLYWEEVVEVLLSLVNENPELFEYYSKFKTKYINVL